MIPIPKYEINQRVFAGYAERVERRKQCVDCLGTKEWEVHTPAGEVFHIACGTCHYGYFSMGDVIEYVESPIVQELTIGSVQIDTADREHVIRYMCRETGVGTGRLWGELQLRPTREQAEEVAKEDAADKTAKWNAEADKQRAESKKREQRKPSWDRRRIRELEKQIKELGGVANA